MQSGILPAPDLRMAYTDQDLEDSDAHKEARENKVQDLE